jgi:hypothetical protein
MRAQERPLAALTLIALAPRLVAAFFSGGYFAQDDHFLIIEAAGSWVDAPGYSTWLPWNQGPDARPSGHSFFYVGLHYLLFSGLKAIGLVDPKAQMAVVRLLHALWSLVAVRAGYRIALRLSDASIAWRTGLLLALFCWMPFLSVRNLVEVACIPFLLLGAWSLIRGAGRPAVRDALIAGLWIGLAINVRFQVIFFAAGAGLAFLLQRDLRGAVVYALGLLLPLAVLQGGIDLVLWGRPFAEITEYVAYNLANPTTYGVQPWYNYLLLLAGMLLPPLSLAVLFGFFRRTAPLHLWLAVLAFLAIHSWFPNKQERFLLPIVPLFLVLGYVSWEQWRAGSAWWQARTALWRGGMAFFWALNLLLLPVLTTAYSKRSRVEALYALRQYPQVRGIVMEDSAEGEAPLPPLYYWGRWDATVVPWTDPGADLAAEMARHTGPTRPNAVLFFGLEDLAARLQRAEAAFGPLQEVRRCEPGLVDRVVHWLNPINRNETIVIALPADTAP